jgi:hypothetical protein
VLLIKKLMLIIASSTFVTAAPAQAAIGCGINVVYLTLLEVKRPMPYRPSTSAWFQGKNFFHLVERSSASTSLGGSLLAFLGASNKSLVDVFGTIFAIMNITYVLERDNFAAEGQPLVPPSPGLVQCDLASTSATKCMSDRVGRRDVRVFP